MTMSSHANLLEERLHRRASTRDSREPTTRTPPHRDKSDEMELRCGATIMGLMGNREGLREIG